MDIDSVIAKYTGQPVTFDDLCAGARDGGQLAALLANAVMRSASAVEQADTELARLADTVARSAAAARANVDADAHTQVPTLNPRGELSSDGPRFDAVVAVRDERITHLHTLVRLWQATHRQPPHTA